MTMTRQQRRLMERAERILKDKINAFRRTNPLAEETYKAGYAEGWAAACDFTMKSYFAAAVLAMHDLEGYSTVRNTRMLRAMESYVVNALTTEELMDEALARAGVSIDFREPFPDDRIQPTKTIPEVTAP